MTLVLSVVVVFVQAQYVTNTHTADEVLKERGELFLKFSKFDVADVYKLSTFISIDEEDEDGNIYAYANKKGFEKIKELKIDYTLLYNPSELIDVAMYDGTKGIYDWNEYPTYDEYVSMMYQFQADFPDLCTVESIGTTVDGRELLVARISDNVTSDENEPEFLYTGTMHGDETVGYVLLLRLIDHLLSNYGTSDRITNMVNNMEIYINPLANPDGTFAGGNNSVNGATRYNGNNIDLNRNYPDAEEGDHPDGNVWQPETVAFMAFAENHSFVSSANFHSGAEVINYPWDTWSTLHADDDWMRFVSHEYADTCHAHSPSTYMSDYDNGITNGYQWYSISGGRQDYMNYFQHCREITIELSDVKLLPENQLEDHWEYNYRSLLNFIEQANYGFYGVVTDVDTENPINAEISIVDHESNNSSVVTSMPFGNYYRPIKAGTYDICYNAPCYDPVTIENVSIEDYTSVEQNVSLQSSGFSADFYAEATNISVGQTVSFTDVSCGNPTSWEWAFEGGTPVSSVEENPSVLYDTEGVYSVTLTITNGSDESTTIKDGYIVVSVNYFMDTKTVITCTGNFYDDGGADGNYSDGQNSVMTFYPATTGAMMRAEFVSFNTEAGYDFLKIYDGESVSDNLIGEYDGSSSPGTIVSTHETGALTFKFTSDVNTNKEGWLAYMSCEGGSSTGIQNFGADIMVFPNPVKGDRLNIVSGSIIDKIELLDLSGRKIYEKNINSNRMTILKSDVESGLYLMKIFSDNNTVVKKIQFIK